MNSHCDICFELFDDGAKAPRIIPCGHVLCQECLHQSAKSCIIQCPWRCHGTWVMDSRYFPVLRHVTLAPTDPCTIHHEQTWCEQLDQVKHRKDLCVKLFQSIPQRLTNPDLFLQVLSWHSSETQILQHGLRWLWQATVPVEGKINHELLWTLAKHIPVIQLWIADHLHHDLVLLQILQLVLHMTALTVAYPLFQPLLPLLIDIQFHDQQGNIAVCALAILHNLSLSKVNCSKIAEVPFVHQKLQKSLGLTPRKTHLVTAILDRMGSIHL